MLITISRDTVIETLHVGHNDVVAPITGEMYRTRGEVAQRVDKLVIDFKLMRLKNVDIAYYPETEMFVLSVDDKLFAHYLSLYAEFSLFLAPLIKPITDFIERLGMRYRRITDFFTETKE